MITLNLKSVDNFVEKLQRKGVDVRWDGWDMIFFTPHRKALRSKNGRRRKEVWGFETTVSPNAKGQWLVNPKFAKVKQIGT